jgi:non-heme Fe2+,alpha-ketoglutarate-dependent halogenase
MSRNCPEPGRVCGRDVSSLRRLTAAQLARYEEDGYLAGLPVFSATEVAALQAEYPRLAALLPPGKNINYVNWWHKRNRFLYDLCLDPRLLDCVEDILGPDFFLWGSHFFVKEPHDERMTPWHQDAQYWPLTPQNAVTVFIAFSDCDRENGCLRVIPGTHRGRRLRHHVSEDARYTLPQEIDADEFDPADAAYLELRAGEISLHHDGLVHGSAGNPTSRPRIAFTMRFSSSDVRCDLGVWPNFQAFPARGRDPFGRNPVGTPPTGYGAPTGMGE